MGSEMCIRDRSEVQIEIKAPEILFRKFGEQPEFAAKARLTHDLSLIHI